MLSEAKDSAQTRTLDSRWGVLINGTAESNGLRWRWRSASRRSCQIRVVFRTTIHSWTPPRTIACTEFDSSASQTWYKGDHCLKKMSKSPGLVGELDWNMICDDWHVLLGDASITICIYTIDIRAIRGRINKVGDLTCNHTGQMPDHVIGIGYETREWVDLDLKPSLESALCDSISYEPCIFGHVMLMTVSPPLGIGNHVAYARDDIFLRYYEHSRM